MTTSQAPVVWMNGKRFKVVYPHIPDPDHWVRMIPYPEKKKKNKPVCAHDFHNVGLSNGIITGQRCSKCGKQEWF